MASRTIRNCLPAHYGQECTEAVAQGLQSLVFQEAENRVWAQMTVLVDLLGHGPAVAGEVAQVRTGPAVALAKFEHAAP